MSKDQKKILIVPSNFKREKKETDDIQLLTENDFMPTQPFFLTKDIEPESFDEIESFGIFEKSKYLREILKKIDYLLIVDGKLKITYFTKYNSVWGGGGHCYIRPFSFFMYELSLCYGKRYSLVNIERKTDITVLEYKKNKPSLTPTDAITKWSFGIISNGQKTENILKTIIQIASFKIPHYEIIICGPDLNFSNPDKIPLVQISDADLLSDLQGPITIKKNRIINKAKYNNLVLMHDRISFPPDWYHKIVRYGNYFEVLTNKILDLDTKMRRVQDWMRYRGEFIDYKNNKGQAMPYHYWNYDVFVDGGFMICKKDILQKAGYNESLHWGEAEDVDLSRRLYQNGVMINFYSGAEVYTLTNRHPGSSSNNKLSSKIKAKIYLIISPLFNFIKRKRQKSVFQKFILQQNV